MIAPIRSEALRLGFIAAGITRAEKPPFYDHFKNWVSAGRHAEMSWLERSVQLRRDPQAVLQGCRTVIALAYPYSQAKPATPDGLTAARFSEPQVRDYHYRLRRLGHDLTAKITAAYPKSRTRVCVDSAPLLERSYAFAAGIGFIGKNNMLIVPGYGSYLFLMEILTTADLAAWPAEPMETQCGACNRCVAACPTGALERPFCVNAAKCLSYLTIEHSSMPDPDTGSKMGDCFFGCDACQEACPFNRGRPARRLALPAAVEILKMTPAEFKAAFGKTAFYRAGLEKTKRNIEIIRSRKADDVFSQ